MSYEDFLFLYQTVEMPYLRCFAVFQAPKPCPFVKEMQDAAMFYTNRVLKEYKEK